MINWPMKIAFVGDSFCANDTAFPYPSYLYLLENKMEIILEGRPGNPLFHSYEELLTIIDIADYIVFCVTEPSRLPNKHSFPICLGVLDNDFQLLHKEQPWSEFYSVPPSAIKRILNSATAYYEDIISYEFHTMAQKGILMQIDELLLQKKKKVIWFPCFNDSMQEYIPKSGPVGDMSLHSISGNHPPNDKRPNHFSQQSNENMANLIINIIDSNDFTPKEIKMKDYFEILK